MYCFAFNLEILHVTERFFFTGCARGACDKYDVWTHGLLSISNHAS